MAVRPTTTLGAATFALAGLVGAAIISAGGSASAATTCAATAPTAAPTPTATTTASASPTASASASSSASASASASPSASASGGILPLPVVPILPGGGQETVSGSPSASASATASATATATPTVAPTPTTTTKISVSPASIANGTSARVTITGLPGCTASLLAKTAPGTVYHGIRSGTLGDNGTIVFSIQPASNTRLYAKSTGSKDSASISLGVQWKVSLTASRSKSEVYVFSGAIAPGTQNTNITVYRTSSHGAVKVATAVTQSDGTWSVQHIFSGKGTFDFTAYAGATSQNQRGHSPAKRLTIS